MRIRTYIYSKNTPARVLGFSCVDLVGRRYPTASPGSDVNYLWLFISWRGTNSSFIADSIGITIIRSSPAQLG